MSVKRNNSELNDDTIHSMAKLKSETEEQCKEKHYEFDQILQLQNKQLLELELEQKKQQEKLKIKQQQQTNNLKKVLNLNIPFKEKQRILNEQKNNLLKRAKYRQEILDHQPPVEMALKMVLYFQHQHHQDTYNLLLYQHNQLQHAKSRKEQAHLFLEHQQMFLKLIDIQQKVLLQTLVEQQEKAEYEISAIRHLSLNDKDDDDNEHTDVDDKRSDDAKNQTSFETLEERKKDSTIFELPQDKDFESLKQPIPSTPNQILAPYFLRSHNKNKSDSQRLSRDKDQSDTQRLSRNKDQSDTQRHSRSISQSSSDSSSSTTSLIMSSPLFSFTEPKSTEALNEEIKDSYLLKDVVQKHNMNNFDDHKRKEKEFMERSSAYLECKNIKDIKIDVPIHPSYHKKMNGDTKKNIDDFFYKAYQKYTKTKFIKTLRDDMIKNGFNKNVFKSIFDEENNENSYDDDDGSNERIITKNSHTISSDSLPPSLEGTSTGTNISHKKNLLATTTNITTTISLSSIDNSNDILPSTTDKSNYDTKEIKKEKEKKEREEDDKEKDNEKNDDEKEQFIISRGRPKNSTKNKMEVYKSKMKKGSKDNMEGTVIVDGEVIKYKEYIVENKDQSGNKSGIKYKHKRIIRRYFCSKEGCRKSFTTSGHVIRHIHSCHLALRPFICKYPGCRSRFGRQDNLRQHYKVHFRKYPKIKFNYREVLTQKQIRELNISPEIMNVNNDELYQYRKSNKEKSDDNMDDNEKHNMVYQKMDHNQETCVLDQPIPSSFQNTKSEIVADDYRTDYSNTLYDDQTSYETPFSSTIYDDQASYSSTTYDDQISSSFVIEDEYKNLTSDLVVLPGTELVPTANESDIIDLEQKTLSKEKHFSLPEESSKRKEKTKTSTEDHPENDQEEGDTSSNPSNSVKMKIKMKNKMNKAPTFKNKQNHNTEIEMNWKLKNPMVDTNLNLTTENNTKDSQMDKDTSFPTSYASEYDVQYTLELDRSHPSMNNIPSTSQLTSLPIKMDNPKVGTLDPNNSNVLNISNVPAIMPSPFLKKVEPTSVISQQLFTSPSLNALNSLSLSNITNPNEHGTKASTLNKSDDESITIPGKITTLTPLSTTANTMISNNPSNRLMSSNNSFSISSLDSHSMVRPTPTVNRSNSLPNPQHTPIVALSSTSSNTTSSDYLDIIQLPPPMLSQDPDQRVNPSLPPPISISKNYFITHPSQASSPTTTLYGQNVLYQTIPTPLSSNPQQNVQVPFPSLDYSSSYDNTSSTSTTPSSSKVYLSNTSYHSVNPENTFQNTNPWLLEFQPITTPAYQNYPNYHLNSIENSDMEIMKKRLHTTTATQNIDSFYYI